MTIGGVGVAPSVIAGVKVTTGVAVGVGSVGVEGIASAVGLNGVTVVSPNFGPNY